MNDIGSYTRGVANSIVTNVITNFDPEARINFIRECSSPIDLLRLSRVSYSVKQLEQFEKTPIKLAEQDADLFPSENILEQQSELSVDEVDEGPETSESQGSNQQLTERIASLEINTETKKSIEKVKTPLIKIESPFKLLFKNKQKPSEQVVREDSKDDISESDMFFYSKLNKEGTLRKKCSNFLLGWQERYVVIQNSKLIYAKSSKAFLSKKSIRCINFLTQKCQIVQVDDRRFSIEVVGTKRKLMLKATSSEEASDWVGRITKVLNYVDIRKNSVAEYPLISEKKPWKMDSISRHEFFETVQSGDILLFQTQNFFAKLQRKLTGSDYDHVAICFKLHSKLYFFEATGDSGVSMTSWDEFVMKNWKRFYTKIAVRHLILEKPIEKLWEKIYDFIMDTSGAEYRLNMVKIFKRNSSTTRSVEDKTARKNEGYFCSELVAAGYKRLGLLDEQKASSQYWPVHFTSKKNLKLLNGAKLSNEIQIIFEK